MTTKPHAALPADYLWGVPAIAAYINKPVRATYYLIERGVIPTKKFGERIIVARTSEIDKALAPEPTPLVKPKRT